VSVYPNVSLAVFSGSLQAVFRFAFGRVAEVDVVPGYHASGHASGPGLLQLVKTVRPKVRIPIHTEQPQ